MAQVPSSQNAPNGQSTPVGLTMPIGQGAPIGQGTPTGQGGPAGQGAPDTPSGRNAPNGQGGADAPRAPIGPARRLFGGSETPGATRPRSLDALVSVSGAYDDDLGADKTGASLSGVRQAGQYQDVDTSLSFVHSQPRFGLTARTDGGVRHYPAVSDFIGSNFTAGATVTGRVSRLTSLRAHVDGYHVSTRAFDTLSRRSPLDGGSPTPVPIQDASVNWTTGSFGASADLERALGTKSSFGLGYGARAGNGPFIGEHGRDQTVTSQVGHRISPDTELVAMYAFRAGEQFLVSGARTSGTQDAQLGVEHQWRASAVKRTTLHVSGGPSFIAESSARRSGERAHLTRWVGGVALTHEDVQRWSLQASYRRGAGLRDTVTFSDTATLDVRAWLSRRVDVTVSAGYSDGDMAVELSQDELTTGFGTAKVQVGLTRSVALYGQSFLYHYVRQGAVPLPLTPRQIDRRGIRGGLILWLPVR